MKVCLKQWENGNKNTENRRHFFCMSSRPISVYTKRQVRTARHITEKDLRVYVRHRHITDTVGLYSITAKHVIVYYFLMLWIFMFNVCAVRLASANACYWSDSELQFPAQAPTNGKPDLRLVLRWDYSKTAFFIWKDFRYI